MSRFKLSFNSFTHTRFSCARSHFWLRTLLLTIILPGARMVFNTRGTRPRCSNNAQGRFDTMELDIWHGRLCHQLPTSNWCGHWQPRYEDAKSWAGCPRVGDCKGDPWYFEGMCLNFSPLIKFPSNLFPRYSSTAPFSFHAIPQISAPSFLWWTALTNTSPHLLKICVTPWLFAVLWL